MNIGQKIYKDGDYSAEVVWIGDGYKVLVKQGEKELILNAVWSYPQYPLPGLVVETLKDADINLKEFFWWGDAIIRVQAMPMIEQLVDAYRNEVRDQMMFFVNRGRQKLIIHGPDITYKYHNQGDIKLSRDCGFSVKVDISDIGENGENIPGIWQSAFLDKWRNCDRGPEEALSRLRELCEVLLQRQPDHELALRHAWLIGLKEKSDFWEGWVAAIKDNALKNDQFNI